MEKTKRSNAGRPGIPARRLAAIPKDRTALTAEKFRARLRALGYPGFSHIARPVQK